MKKLLLSILALGTPLITVQAAPGKATFLPPGSKERKAVLDALRKPVERNVKQTVVFYEVKVRTKSNWAYVQAVPRNSQGKTLKAFDPDTEPAVIGLLKKQGNTWKVLYFGFGTSMDPVSEARHKYPKAPRSLFPSLPGEFPGDGSYGGNGFNNHD
ncbi:hypothetical protein IAD21_01363 [Abditibacteriota bacterium]|nr:hypothetical protein IAD21_01363 [Abditibacteriota bacterium]